MTFEEWFEQNFLFDDDENEYCQTDIYFAAKEAWQASRENMTVKDI